jgi:hypothetical protein
MELDDWQREVLATNGNIVLRSGRQVGKSTVISIKAAEFAIQNAGKVVMVVASVERQALLLFEKVLGYLYDNYKGEIKRGKYKPTKHKLQLKNGSVIHCLPTGLSGYGIRGYTIDLLIVDEAAFVEDAVFTAITPALAITKGDIILLSTPFGKQGYFFRCFSDPSFTSFHVSSEDCPRKDQVFLDQEKERMTVLQYSQEYLGEFVDELRQFFPTELIKSCMTAEKVGFNNITPPVFLPSQPCFLGVDVARMGGDETVLYSLQMRKETLYDVGLDISKGTKLTDTVRLILDYDMKYNYKNIYIDDGGMGVGVFDPLLEHDQTKRKVVAINNSARALDREAKRKKKLLKEDLYNNLLVMMERGRIKLRESNEVLLSLKSVQVEYTHKGMRIFGSYTHIAEALIRSAWCVKAKSLNIYIY